MSTAQSLLNEQSASNIAHVTPCYYCIPIVTAWRVGLAAVSVKRATLLIKCNDIVIDAVAVIPIIARPSVEALANSLKGEVSGWDAQTAFINGWFRQGA